MRGTVRRRMFRVTNSAKLCFAHSLIQFVSFILVEAFYFRGIRF